MPRLVTDKEIIPQVDQNLILKKTEGENATDSTGDKVTEEEKDSKDEEKEKEPANGTIMKVPPLLEQSIPVLACECISKVKHHRFQCSLKFPVINGATDLFLEYWRGTISFRNFWGK